MKKLFLLLLVAVVFAACEKTDPVAEMENDLALKKANKSMAIDFNGPHFELNLLGKKDGWNDKEVDNPDRHTMFIPRYTTDWTIELKKPNNLGEEMLPGIRIDMTQGEEFAVLDGTVFDGDGCEFQLGKGKYHVLIAMRGKKKGTSAQVDGWLEALETTVFSDGTEDKLMWYYQNLGTVDVKRSWTNITDLFAIDEEESGELPWYGDEGTVGEAPVNHSGQVWIFEYMDWLGEQVIEVDLDGDGVVDETLTYSDLAYFWQLQNNGSQLIKVRFYPI